MFFFFFQAEDGIRDLTVTGVQTCALPISCVSWLLGGSIRPPPVHFPVTHCAGGGVNQKLGRFGAMLTFGWSVHAPASSPAARRLGQTIRVPCSRIMAVLPSLLTIPASVRFASHTARPLKE